MSNSLPIKFIKKLQQKKFRDEFNSFVVEGIKGVAEALNSNWQVRQIVVQEDTKTKKEIAALIKIAKKKNIQFDFCTTKQAQQIQSTTTFTGILAVVERKHFKLNDLKKDKPIIILDSVSDPGNLGTIIRSADWFDLPNIILSKNCVDLFSPKVVRSTMGSLFHLNVHVSENLDKTVQEFKKQGYEINTFSTEGKNIKNMKPGKNSLYIFGNETHGISPSLQKLADNTYSIPGAGVAESLNLSIAAGIVMFKLTV